MSNIVWHQHAVSKQSRSELKGQKPLVIWFTGLSGAGKSTLAGALEQALAVEGKHTYLLDGDNVRHGLCGDLGFDDAARQENIRRVGEVAKLMVDAGLIVLTAFISPFRAERELVRNLLGADEFVEVFVDAPLAVCEERDPKGLYKKARAGEIRNFTGIDSAYEAPKQPEIHLLNAGKPVAALVDELLTALRQGNYL
ncbi:adenylylsulfate kinase [Aeromonas salmonicida subsp. salmonicida]|uniref:Adenylyl-sulfate kinase n=2 Tax=Aeromonas salmonicida subsp. salmonicida TaxID=29491 RepID=CYSC_AERS4|nr:adenylyl-sulfate kinase [Aeromonas salmonicida]A4SRG6.1 RecName: Full=Adenylyl-sulfate kinase; AltName: Full=APS kinase; AltName: Full=ATP adenosine-5'-phosphosulfate 3'-phosphotransferase; AltName: Full=Adenosine-5'-phosphosulfate kinase [Aeromonas salmonicida subsp. salmonicida A449]ABO91488.1 adenylylsulfate kinase [Aeromonas salmonicida subsp. salmonicida A449]ASI22347.1 adenylyl-sulfate kinase [Aeromonas salmonicida]ASI26662.1 adenylyl-sulfate kinase [Aeromonas salmonicida]ASI30783.1 a